MYGELLDCLQIGSSRTTKTEAESVAETPEHRRKGAGKRKFEAFGYSLQLDTVSQHANGFRL